MTQEEKPVEQSPADQAADTITQTVVDELLKDKKKLESDNAGLKTELDNAKELIKKLLHGQQAEPQGPPQEEEETPDEYIKRVYWDREQFKPKE